MSTQVYAKQHINLKLNFSENKSYYEKRAAHWHTATSCRLNLIKRRHIDIISFRLSKSLYSRYVLLKSTNNFGSVFTNRFDRRIYKTKFPTQVSFFFQFFYFSKRFNFFFDDQNILLVKVATLSLYRSFVNYRSSKIHGNFTRKVNSTDYCHYQAWNLQLPERVVWLAFSRATRKLNSQDSLLLGNYIGTDNWQCRYIRGDCTYVRRTKQGRNTRAFLRIIWYH